MKRFIKTAVALTAALALSVCCLSACGEKKGGADPNTLVVLYEGTNNPGTGDADAMLRINANLLEGVKKDDTKLRAQYTMTKAAVEAAEALGKKVELWDWGWAEQLRQKMTGAFLSSTGPDVIIGEGAMVDYMNQDALVPYPDDLADYIRENLVPAAYKAMEREGKIYGVAPQPSSLMLVIDKIWAETIFGEGYEAPATWAEWLDDLDEVNVYKAANSIADKDLMPGGIYMGPQDGGYLRIMPFFKMASAGVVDDIGKPCFEGENNGKVLEFLRSMESKNPTGILNSQKLTVLDRFAAGTCVFNIEGSWSIKFAKTFERELIVAPLPKPSESSSPANTLVGGCFYGVPNFASAEKHEAAFAYIKGLIGPTGQADICGAEYRLPVNKACVTEEWLDENPLFKPYYEAMKLDLMSLPNFKTQNNKSWSIVGDALLLNTQRKNVQTYEKIMTDAQKSLMDIYSKN